MREVQLKTLGNEELFGFQVYEKFIDNRLSNRICFCELASSPLGGEASEEKRLYSAIAG